MGWLNTGASVMFAVIVTGSIVTHHPPREPTDAFRMIGAFPRMVSISTSTNDSSFKCMSAVRTRFDPQAKKATYIWHLRDDHGRVRKNVRFDIEEGTEIDQVVYYVDGDRTHPFTAYYNYTDYRNCMVIIVPYSGHDHCMLWVRRAVANSVPLNCLDKYEENCDVLVPTYDKDLCKARTPRRPSSNKMGGWQVRTCLMLAVLVGAIIAANRGERTDAFRMIEAFSRPVSIFKSSNNSPFMCLSATRTRFDPQAKEATYIWSLRDDHGRVKQNVSFEIEKGKEIDQVTFYVDDDRTHPFTAYCNYTDYQNCMVVNVPYSGHNHCMLWLQRRVAHNVPQNCLDKYEENCGVKIPTYNSDLCKDD